MSSSNSNTSSSIRMKDFYSDYKYNKLCSGYGVFPDGKECKGCSDCKKEEFFPKEDFEI